MCWQDSQRHRNISSNEGKGILMISQDPRGGAAVAPYLTPVHLCIHTYTQFWESTVPKRMLLAKCSLKETIGRINEQRITSMRVKPDWFNTDTHHYRKANYTDTWSTALCEYAQRNRSLKHENLLMIYPNFSPNPYDLLFSVEHKRRYLHKTCVFLFYIMKMKGNRYCQCQAPKMTYINK